MKYLKEYKIFESNKIDLYKVKEVFYNISDKLNVSFLKFNATTHRYRKDITDKTIKPYISIEIKKLIKGYEDNYTIMEFENIKDDLDFAVNYLTKELNLILVDLYVFGSINRHYTNYNNFLRDFDLGEYRNIYEVKFYFEGV